MDLKNEDYQLLKKMFEELQEKHREQNAKLIEVENNLCKLHSDWKRLARVCRERKYYNDKLLDKLHDLEDKNNNVKTIIKLEKELESLEEAYRLLTHQNVDVVESSNKRIDELHDFYDARYNKLKQEKEEQKDLIQKLNDRIQELATPHVFTQEEQDAVKQYQKTEIKLEIPASAYSGMLNTFIGTQHERFIEMEKYAAELEKKNKELKESYTDYYEKSFVLEKNNEKLAEENENMKQIILNQEVKDFGDLMMESFGDCIKQNKQLKEDNDKKEDIIIELTKRNHELEGNLDYIYKMRRHLSSNYDFTVAFDEFMDDNKKYIYSDSEDEDHKRYNYYLDYENTSDMLEEEKELFPKFYEKFKNMVFEYPVLSGVTFEEFRSEWIDMKKNSDGIYTKYDSRDGLLLRDIILAKRGNKGQTLDEVIMESREEDDIEPVYDN